MRHSIYRCDCKFHTDEILSMLTDSPTYGLVAIDGNACVIGTISGDDVKIIKSFSDELPNRHKSGGQSSQRFQRLRLERRDAYLNKANENVIQAFVSEGVTHLSGMFLTGCAEFKDQLFDKLIPVLKSIHIKSFTSASTGKHAFYEAVEKCRPEMKDNEFTQNEKILHEFLTSLQNDDGKAVVGMRDVCACLEEDLVDKLVVLKDSGIEHEGIELHVWASERYPYITYVVTDRTVEGASFAGYGGIGAILRYAVDESVYKRD